ncbi:MAG: 2-dehydro-3-deoxy-6-phosphogalactonate aldolase [Sphingorhabdus sp.]
MNKLAQLTDRFTNHIHRCPLIAILRGIRPDEILAVGRALMECGINIIEIPLNSPDPLESIRRLAADAGDNAIVGAGTVLRVEDVAAVKKAGGQLVVSPNTDPHVIAATVSAGMISIPGYFTPTEAFAAIHAGAHAIKLFPAEAASPAVVKAQRAVLPAGFPLFIVGGVQAEDATKWLSAGASGFGLGGALYRPGYSASHVYEAASQFVAALPLQDLA